MKYNLKIFIEKAKEIHNNKYDYSLSKYIDSQTKLKIICPNHGIFEQTPNMHLSHQGCPKCGIINRSKTQSLCKSFENRFRKIHGNLYDYSKVVYKNRETKVIIGCKIHGDFYQSPAQHIRGQGCPKCGNEKKSKSKTKDTFKFIKLSQKIHGKRYEYENSIYTKRSKKINIKCRLHGNFEQLAGNHLQGHGCPKCGFTNSFSEDFIERFFLKNNIRFEKRNRKIIGLELDFICPDFNIAIECNGIYWHSELAGKSKNYHLEKQKKCQKAGYRLIHYTDFQIKTQPNIVKSHLNSVFKIKKYRIYARNCIVKNIDTSLKNKFLKKYHFQGDDKSSVKLGLFYRNRLVSIMTFCKRRIALGCKNIQKNEYELSRYCLPFSICVIGGQNKLLSFFEKNYNPTKIISYSDKSRNSGDVYNKMGFIKSHESPPNYWYFKQDYLSSDGLYHRYSFRKDVLNKKLKTFNINLSEWENMKNNNWNRIWDCGSDVYKKTYNKSRTF